MAPAPSTVAPNETSEALMLRRANFVLFALALGLAVACGRQVTPEPKGTNLSGFITLKFRTQSPYDFSQFNYWMVFNTSGQGGTPYANGFQTGYKNYSYAFVIGAATGGTGTVLPILFQFYVQAGVPRTRQFNLDPATTSLQLATDGVGKEFTLIFPRSALALPPPTATSQPSAGPTPTPTPTPVGATPTPTPSGNATATPSPVASATVAAQATWYMNLFVTDNANPANVLDALGLGKNDQSFTNGTFDVNTPDDIVYNQPPESAPPPNPASQLAGFELINTQ